MVRNADCKASQARCRRRRGPHRETSGGPDACPKDSLGFGKRRRIVGRLSKKCDSGKTRLSGCENAGRNSAPWNCEVIAVDPLWMPLLPRALDDVDASQG